MTDLDFIDKMLTRFQKKDGSNRESIMDNLDVFCKKCVDTHYQDVYEHAIQNMKYFNINKLFEFARNKNFVDAKDSGVSVVYWNECKNCGRQYTKQGRGCPKCRCTVSIIKTGDYLPENIIDVQEDCFYCTIYPESVKKENERKLYFTGCTQFGIKQDAQCSACECKECCRQMMQYNADPKGTTEKYKTTELGQPWIIPVAPLNETVKAMIEDMTGRR